MDQQPAVGQAMYDSIFLGQDIPQTWLHYTLVMLAKKAVVHQPEDLRPIALLSVFYRLFARL
eukprot:11883451-Prorocentrum_lima.AAC.1